MEHVSSKASRIRSPRIATLLALSLIPLSGFAIDIYIPSLPAMAKDLGITSLQSQLTISIFLISYGFGQLFVGGLLDSFGRYKLSLISIVIFAASCLTIALTHSIYVIYAMRVVHGLTVAMIIVSKRAYFVDMFSGEKLKHYLSIFTIIWSAGPILAPFVGGYLQSLFGWSSNFYFLAIAASVIALLEFIYSGETLKQATVFNLKKITSIYAEMLKTANFTLGICMLGIAYSMVMVYNMTGSYIIEHHYKLTPVISGYCSLFLGIAWMTGGFIGKALINKPFYAKLTANLVLQMVIITVMIASLSFVNNLFSLLTFAFLIQVTAGFTYNNYFPYSMSLFPKNAGIAGGLTGGVNYILVSALSYFIVSNIPANDERNLSYSYLILILFSAITMLTVLRLRKKNVSAQAA
jgi:MFS family permease